MPNHDPLFIPAGRTRSAVIMPNRSILDPGRLLQVLGRYWAWLLVPPLLLAVGGYVLSSRQPARYSATTSLVFQPTAAQDRLDGDRSNTSADRDMQTQEELLNGRLFRAEVAESFGDDVEFEAQAVEGTDVVELEVTAATPQLAAEAVDEIAASVVERRQTQVQAELAEAIDALQQIVDDRNAELDVIDRALAGIAGEAIDPGISTLTTVPRAGSESSLLRRQTVLADELLAAESALRELESEALLTNGDVAVAGPAVLPTEPVSPALFEPRSCGGCWAHSRNGPCLAA